MLLSTNYLLIQFQRRKLLLKINSQYENIKLKLK